MERTDGNLHLGFDSLGFILISLAPTGYVHGAWPQQATVGAAVVEPAKQGGAVWALDSGLVGGMGGFVRIT